MDPKNEPWTPKPYQPKTDEPQAQANPQPMPPTDPYAWQRPAEPAPINGQQELPPVPMPPQTPQPMPQQGVPMQPNLPQQQAVPPMQQAVPPAPQPQPQSATPPQPQQQWTPPIAPQPALNPTQQYGGKMAELPPLQPSAPKPAKKQRMILWIVIAALVLLPAIGIGIYFLTSLSNDSNQQKTNQQLEKLTYNNDALAELSKKPLTNEAVAQLNKEATFYTVFKQVATQPIIQTKWDVYFTEKAADKRGDQYTLYNTTIDYKSKKYAYAENTYSNLGVYQTRCIGDKQYNYNDSKLTTNPAWQPASDSTDCQLNTVTMHTSDGLNTGGLSSEQADTFIRKIKGYNAVQVKDLSVVTHKEKQYIKVNAEVIPQKQGDNIYWGMQLFMNAFQATGLDAEKHPYTFFGSGREGAQMTYYIDPATQLPVYAVMHSTAPLGGNGKPELVKEWSHRIIEYTYPKAVVDNTLDNTKPISFETWPDH